MDSQSRGMVQGPLSLFLIILSIVLVYVAFGPLARYSASLNSSRTIAVSATGDVVAKPDVAVVTFSVVSEGKDVGVVVNENNEKVNKAITALENRGIAEEDIKTSEYNLQPVYTQGGSFSVNFVPTIARYSLTQSIEVKIRNFEIISPAMSDLLSLGANRVSNLYFSIDDPEQYQAQAREKAFAEARAKAQTMAEQNGLRLGRVINVSEYAASPYYPLYSSRAEGLGGGADMKVAAPQIEPGSQKVAANVTIVYELK